MPIANLKYKKIKLAFKRSLLTNYCLHFESIDSTNDWLKNHPTAGLIISTNYQSQGKGRLGRTWQAKPRRSLMFSTLYQIKQESFFAPILSLVAAVAICRTLHNLEIKEVCLKWPNDLLVGKKKLGGILCENLVQKKMVVIGMGINVNQSEIDFAPELRQQASSLKIVKNKNFVILHLLEQTTLELDKLLLDLEKGRQRAILEEWQSYAMPMKKIIYQQATEFIEAKIEGIDYNNGNLLVITEKGERKQLCSGEITIKQYQ